MKTKRVRAMSEQKWVDMPDSPGLWSHAHACGIYDEHLIDFDLGDPYYRDSISKAQIWCIETIGKWRLEVKE